MSLCLIGFALEKSASGIFKIPRRDDGMLSGSGFFEKIASLPDDAREEYIFNEISNGNMPDAFRKVVKIRTVEKDAYGREHSVEIAVLPDFLAVGSDSDFVRMPMTSSTAQRIATLFGASLPTRKLSDLIHRSSDVKLTPLPLSPDSTMVTVPVFYRHNRMIEAARIAEGKPLSALIAGHKKDIVITNRLTENGKLFIYGWHYPDGTPIQPLSGAHGAEYVDYSHGVRLVSRRILIDGKCYDIKEILQNSVLCKLISDEDGIMPVTEYPVD